MIACLVATACLLAPVSPAAGVGRPLVSLVATPSTVVLAGRARQTIRIENTGRKRVVVDVVRTGFGLDLRGRPRILPRGGPRTATSWLTVRPVTLAIPPGGSRPLTLSSRVPRRAEPGDHGALILLATRPSRRGAVFVRMRLGVVVVVRAPGRIVRRLVPLRVRVRRAGRFRLVELVVANRGNVTEVLGRGCVSVSLRRGGKVLTRLGSTPRHFLPRSSGIEELRYRGPVRGWVRAVIESSKRAQCGRLPPRSFRIRL